MAHLSVQPGSDGNPSPRRRRAKPAAEIERITEEPVRAPGTERRPLPPHTLIISPKAECRAGNFVYDSPDESSQQPCEAELGDGDAGLFKVIVRGWLEQDSNSSPLTPGPWLSPELLPK